MASTSHHSGSSRIATAANALYSDNQSLIAEIRKSINLFKGVAVDLEKEEKSDKVKQLEDAVVELLEAYDDCTRFSDAVKSIGDTYQPSDQPTDFKNVLETEVKKLKERSPFVAQNTPLYRTFREAIWNVHHAGQPMPGEEQEDIIMTSTQNNILNTKCPLTGKPIIEVEDPVRCMDCKHIYEKAPIMHYIRTTKPQPICPVAGCPKVLRTERVVCDSELPIEIEEMRSEAHIDLNATEVEDFTELDDDCDEK